MAHTFALLMAVHIYSTKIKEISQSILHACLLCINNHDHICGLFFRCLSCIYQFKCKWFKVTTSYMDLKGEAKKKHPRAVNTSCKARNRPQKGHTKVMNFI